MSMSEPRVIKLPGGRSLEIERGSNPEDFHFSVAIGRWGAFSDACSENDVPDLTYWRVCLFVSTMNHGVALRLSLKPTKR
jgi:hypothetical protein